MRIRHAQQHERALIFQELSDSIAHMLYSLYIHLSVVDNAIQLTLLFNERLLAALFPPKTGQLVLFRMQAQVKEMGAGTRSVVRLPVNWKW